jgi:hypothetical protein
VGEGPHTFQVRAVSAAGLADDTPATRSWSVDTSPPAAPTGLVAAAGEGSVSLDWTDNSEPDLAGYRVYRREPDGTWPITPIKSTTASVAAPDGRGVAQGDDRRGARRPRGRCSRRAGRCWDGSTPT